MHAFCKNMRSPRLLKRLVKETDERKFSFTNWCGLSGRSAPNTGGTEMMSLQPNVLAEESRSLLIGAGGRMAFGILQECVLHKWTSRHSSQP